MTIETGVELSVSAAKDKTGFVLDGVAPSLQLAFDISSETLSLSDTRASTASYIGRDGQLAFAAADTARFDWSTGRRCLLVEAAATNLVTSSAVLTNGTVTVTATSYVLSFEGTGSVALSGAHAATIAGGSGRKSYVFIPTAGTLTMSASGSVTRVQLETGTIATSYIATSGAAATRAADTISIPCLAGPPIGADKITNGNFSAGTTGWSGDGTSILSVSGGIMTVQRNGGSALYGAAVLRQVLTGLEIGATYQYSVTLTGVSDGLSLGVYDAGFTTAQSSWDSLSGPYPKTFNVYFQANATSCGIGIGARNNTYATISVSQVKVQAVRPWWHAEAGTLVLQLASTEASGVGKTYYTVGNASNLSRLALTNPSAGNVSANFAAPSQSTVTLANTASTTLAAFWGNGTFGQSNGVNTVTATAAGSLSDATTLRLGASLTGTNAFERLLIRKLLFYPARISNAALAALSI